MADSFGARLKLAIRSRKTTQLALADELEVAPARVNEWIKNKWLPEGARILEIVNVLRIDAHWLLTGEGSMERSDEAKIRLGAVRQVMDAPLETLSGRDLGKGRIR